MAKVTEPAETLEHLVAGSHRIDRSVAVPGSPEHHCLRVAEIGAPEVVDGLATRSGSRSMTSLAIVHASLASSAHMPPNGAE